MIKPEISGEKIRSFCDKWKIREFFVFGSYLNENFSDESDIDIVIDFHPGDEISLITFITMKEELEALLQRNVDVITKNALISERNTYIRDSILNSMVPVYVT